MLYSYGLSWEESIHMATRESWVKYVAPSFLLGTLFSLRSHIPHGLLNVLHISPKQAALWYIFSLHKIDKEAETHRQTINFLNMIQVIWVKNP